MHLSFQLGPFRNGTEVVGAVRVHLQHHQAKALAALVKLHHTLVSSKTIRYIDWMEYDLHQVVDLLN